MVTRPAPAELDRLVRVAAESVDAPDVVLACAVDGHETVCTTGRAERPRTGPGRRGREALRYEIGSASKPYAGLLLAQLAHQGWLSLDDPAATLLAPHRAPGDHPITLFHLITHTSGLPPLPPDFYLQALPRWTTNPYSGYPPHRVVRAFLRSHPRHRPGTRWRYSNFGAAVLGHALTAATDTDWDTLLRTSVLEPLGLRQTRTVPGGPGVDALGHAGADGATPMPPLRIGGFQAAGAVHATPGDLLRFLQAHLEPDRTPLGPALRTARTPVLRRALRGPGSRESHSFTWFLHPTDRGPLYFHAGATSGQQAFLGFHPESGTALVALATRRFRLGDDFVGTAYALLRELAGVD
ncbi:serine hydrolase domain-containing protein [Streptomyces sp. NPDC005438]|uniref:serine hydrolase domain-containing protein n=1 Tax=Streptomyces sp. NPDC005438 TaxID=3156880 RepID=UPI0033A929CE